MTTASVFPTAALATPAPSTVVSAADAQATPAREVAGVREIVVPAVLLALLALPVVWPFALLYDAEAERLEADGADMRTNGEKGRASLVVALCETAMAAAYWAAMWTRWRALSLSVPWPPSRRTHMAMATLPVGHLINGWCFRAALGTSNSSLHRLISLILTLLLGPVYARAMAAHLRGAPDAALARRLLVQLVLENSMTALFEVVFAPIFYNPDVSDAARVGLLLIIPFMMDISAFPARRVAATRVHDAQHVQMATLLGSRTLYHTHYLLRFLVVGMSTATGSLVAAVACSLSEAASRFTMSRRDAFYERVLRSRSCSCLFASGTAEEKPTDPAVVAADAKLRKDVATTFLGLDQVLEIWATLVVGAQFIAFRISASREPPELGAQLGVIGMQLALEVLSDVSAPYAVRMLSRSRAQRYLDLVRRRAELLRGAGRRFWASFTFISVAEMGILVLITLSPMVQRFVCVWPTTEDADWHRVMCSTTEEWMSGWGLSGSGSGSL